MYANLYNRLLAWICLAWTGFGLTTHGIGNYMSLDGRETGVNIGAALLALLCARRRRRYATAMAMILGAVFFAWGVLGIAGLSLQVGLPEPLKSAMRTVVGMWGCYVAAHDVLRWRRNQLAS